MNGLIDRGREADYTPADFTPKGVPIRLCRRLDLAFDEGRSWRWVGLIMSGRKGTLRSDRRREGPHK